MARAVWIIAAPSSSRDRAEALVRGLGLDPTLADATGSPPEGAVVLVHEAVDAAPFASFAPLLFGETTPPEVLTRRVWALAGEHEALLALFLHDLNNPLGAARIVSELLQDEVTGEAARDVADLLVAVDEAVLLGEGLGMHLRLLSGGMYGARSAAELGALVRDALDRPALEGRVALELPGADVPVLANAEAVGQAVRSMVATARRMADEGSAVTVRVKPERAVEVRADGFAVPPDLRERLTQPYVGLVARERRVPVAAFGLAFAGWVAEAHGGRLVVHPREDGFDVTLLLG